MSSSFCWRNTRITTRRSPYHHFSSTRRQHTSLNLPSVLSHNVGITITNVSSRDLVESLLRRQDVQDNLNGPYYSQATTELIDDAILLGYFKTRTHRVVAPKNRVNNPKETEEICAICQAVFENKESIGTLGCGHEYHTSCIKQWLLRRKDCPMCRASVLP